VTVGILSDDERRVVAEQRLGFVVTCCPNGTPNLSPKGTVAAWDGDQLVVTDIASLRSVPYLRRKPALKVNVVDPIARTAYRFKTTVTVHDGGEVYDGVVASYRRRGASS
jgi:hypothetical protein